MKKHIVIFAFVFVSTIQLNAQKNSVNLFMGNNSLYHNNMSKTKNSKLINTLGVEYSRKIDDKLSIGIRYMQPNYSNPYSAGYMGERHFSSHLTIDWYDDVGKLYMRRDYHYWDLGVSYECVRVKKHSLNLKQHISLAHGKDEYVEDIIAYEYPNEFHIIHFSVSVKNAQYWGGVSGLNYNYSLWKERLNVGAEFSLRYYFIDFPFQLNYGLHLGYNF